MRTRLVLGAVGVLMGAFGALRFLQLDLDDLLDAVLWLAAGVVVHDAVVAPLTIAVTVLGTRLVPAAARVRTTLALLVLLTVTATAIPVLGRFGARADNPTLLDRDYLSGWLVLAVLVLVVSLLWGPVARRVAARRRGRVSRAG